MTAALPRKARRGELDGRTVAPRFQNNGVDVPLNMVDSDEGHAAGEAQRLGIGQPDEQGADEARPHGDGDGREVLEAGGRAKQGFAHDGNDGAQVLARCQFGDHTAVLAVRRDLRGHDAGQHGVSARYHKSSFFIARGFDAEDTHSSYLSAGSSDSRSDVPWGR